LNTAVLRRSSIEFGSDRLKDEPNPTSGLKLSTTRRRAAIAIRWMSIPLAVFVAIAPLWSLRSEYRRTANMIPTSATVLDARVVDASRITSEWDVYVRYPLHGKTVENSVRVWTRADLHQGDTIRLLVDPATSDAEDDNRRLGWAMACCGLIVAAFLLLVGFVLLGAMLRRDRQSRQDGLG
jgi:hypothetical protein